jgi:hypothetical protein
MTKRGLLHHTAVRVAACVLGVMWGVSALADTGGLRIRVTDTNDNPIAGAQISAATAESLTRRTGVTNTRGELRLTGLDPSDSYTVIVSAKGYQPARNEGTLVVSERVFNLPFVLVEAEEVLEEIITYGRRDIGQLVDTTSAIQSTDVTLDVMDSLPTGRSYQSYLQMAPTTKPTYNDRGDPSSKSGVNYSDAGGGVGYSSDNIYYIDGINITDSYSGTFAANFNSEIIQEQQIITGGVPAEYEGGQGLVSRVISKSGGNEFHGSVNYYMQSDSLVADNENLDDARFSTFDGAFTLGGPIIRDKLWFFTSYQRKEREEDVIDPNTQELMRTVTRKNDYGFLKLTYQPTGNDKITAEWFSDPYEADGSFDTTTLNSRITGGEAGGDNIKFEYSHAWDNVILTTSYLKHAHEFNVLAADRSTQNNVAYLLEPGDPPVTNADMQLGGAGWDTFWEQTRESLDLKLQWSVDAGPGNHDFKVGYSDITNQNHNDNVRTGDGAGYNSIALANSGTDLDSYAGGGWTGATSISSDDYNRIIAAMAGSPNAAQYLALYDADGSGDISAAELGAGLIFDQTAGNPHGQVNVYRAWQSQQGPQYFETHGNAWFVQDSWNIDEHWTINAGVRAEKWSHYASDGKTRIFTFDWEYAPRLSVIYDLFGNGRSKVWAFGGRYYDPIRMNMTNFAGQITGSVNEEQVYTNAGEWLTYRTRGGPQAPDGYFAPTTKTPYTDEFLVGWEHSLTVNQSIAVTYTDRKTRDILEDYDLNVYLDCSSGGVGDYCLPLSYFGFGSGEQLEANYYIATLKGGKRNYSGWEVSWRKRRSADSQWFALASLVYNDAEGNTNSDSDADFQGDVVWLDPRSPNQFGKQPGNIEWLAKFAGSYAFDNGLEIGATYRWNSGLRYSRTWAIYGRHLPQRVEEAFEDGGVTTRWIAPDAVGGYEGKAYGTLDARVKYTLEFGESMQAEFFLDIFNALDDQAATKYQDVDPGDGVYGFGEAREWVEPRRFYLGTRVSF